MKPIASLPQAAGGDTAVEPWQWQGWWCWSDLLRLVAGLNRPGQALTVLAAEGSIVAARPGEAAPLEPAGGG